MADRYSLVDPRTADTAHHNSDHLAAAVQHRPPGITGVQRGVELNPVQFTLFVAPQRGHTADVDADGGIFPLPAQREPKREAARDQLRQLDEVLVRTQFQGFDFLVAVHFEQGQVQGHVAAQDLGREYLLRFQPGVEHQGDVAVTLPHHMLVGHEEARGMNTEGRAVTRLGLHQGCGRLGALGDSIARQGVVRG